MPPPFRRSDVDACPGALRLHAAADGPLARVRLPGGMLTGAQLAVLGQLARECGDGRLELTSRANIQLRALHPEDLTAVAARLTDTGLLPSPTHETVRNIAAPPLADEPTRRLVHDLDQALCADPELAALPGRFLFAIGEVPLDADVAAVPLGTDTAAVPLGAHATAVPLGADTAVPLGADVPAAPADQVFAVFLAGQDAGLRVGAGEVVPALLAAAHAFLRERTGAAESPAWRMRELPDGPAGVARRTAAALGRPAPSFPFPPQHGVPGGPPLVGLLEQGDALVAVGATVPLGRLEAAAVDLLARARRVVITPARGVVVPDLGRTDAAAWVDALAGAGLVVEAESRWSGVTACAGRPGCAKSLADVRADADAATRHVDGLPVHWVGCARGCGSPAGRHVRVEATRTGYAITREPDHTTATRWERDSPDTRPAADAGSVIAARLAADASSAATAGSVASTGSPATASRSAAAGSVAAGSVAAGSVAAGSVAAGSVAAGSVAAGSVAAGLAAEGGLVADGRLADLVAAARRG